MTDPENTAARGLTSVEQAIEIVEHVRDEGPATLTEIAEAFELPMSTAHVYLSTLVTSEQLIKEDGTYRPSFRFLETGGQLRDELPLFRAGKSEVDDLRDDVDEYTNITTIENGHVVQLYKSESPDSIDDAAPLGAHLHPHSTATGKAMLAHLPAAERDAIIDDGELVAATTATVTDPKALREELEKVREQGYAVNRGEHYQGVCAVGVPILSNSGAVIGAISVSGPRSRLTNERMEESLVPALFERKNIIELKLTQTGQ